MVLWEKSISGIGYNKCKGPEARLCFGIEKIGRRGLAEEEQGKEWLKVRLGTGIGLVDHVKDFRFYSERDGK